MAIRLISAMLVMGTRTDGGDIILLNPLHGIDVPAKQRHGYKDSGAKRGLIVLPNYEIVLVLWGGTPGQHYRITGGVGIPGEPAGKAVTNELVWPDKPSARINLKLQGKIHFERSAIYEYRLVANDEPLGVLPIVIRWDDETDF